MILLFGEHMKHVYLLGDSIRLGYGELVRELLAGFADVHFPEENCRFSLNTLCFLHTWAEQMEDVRPEEIDLVHWNNGLWDVCHFEGDPLPLVPPDVYEATLRRIVQRIRTVFPNAKILFALTTCIDASRTKVQRGVPMRTQAEIDAYNAIARRVMAEEGVGLDRLDEASRLIPPADRADWVHFDPSGSAVLARCAAQAIRGAMDERKEG